MIEYTFYLLSCVLPRLRYVIASVSFCPIHTYSRNHLRYHELC
uniref:Uncharacterized protein n=1 Tax=Rhizophora mucronata TaxID=61149 RepID=A0A2P2NA90_RHIMU